MKARTKLETAALPASFFAGLTLANGWLGWALFLLAATACLWGFARFDGSPWKYIKHLMDSPRRYRDWVEREQAAAVPRERSETEAATPSTPAPEAVAPAATSQEPAPVIGKNLDQLLAWARQHTSRAPGTTDEVDDQPAAAPNSRSSGRPRHRAPSRTAWIFGG